jgi:hypothetical protein
MSSTMCNQRQVAFEERQKCLPVQPSTPALVDITVISTSTIIGCRFDDHNPLGHVNENAGYGSRGELNTFSNQSHH